jgi:hypothetical protein
MVTALHLKRGDVLLGVLRPRDLDFPWVFCRFEPTKAFDEIRPLFVSELALLEADRMEEWEAAYRQISGRGLRLVNQDDQSETSDFLVHVDGETAWFRS